MEADKDLELFSRNQLEEMLRITRSWTASNPNGPLPYLPKPLYTFDRKSQAMKVDRDAEKEYPEYKKAHWLIRLLWKTTRE